MIKLVFALKRRPDLSREDFQRYWLEQHGPLVRKHAAVLHIRRYTQTHTLAAPQGEALSSARSSIPEFYDGVAELYWDSMEDLERAASTPEGRRAARELLSDEASFIDLPNSPLWLGTEHVVVDELSG
jgi:uncharacterized protein (TIGR02118 family)